MADFYTVKSTARGAGSTSTESVSSRVMSAGLPLCSEPGEVVPSAAARKLQAELHSVRDALEQSQVQRAADAASLDAQMRINARLHAKLSLMTTTAGGASQAAPMPMAMLPLPGVPDAADSDLQPVQTFEPPDTATISSKMIVHAVSETPLNSTVAMPNSASTPPTRSTISYGAAMDETHGSGGYRMPPSQRAAQSPRRQIHHRAHHSMPKATASSQEHLHHTLASHRLDAAPAATTASGKRSPSSAQTMTTRPVPAKLTARSNSREKENGPAQVLRAAANAAVLARPVVAHAEINRPTANNSSRPCVASSDRE